MPGTLEFKIHKFLAQLVRKLGRSTSFWRYRWQSAKSLCKLSFWHFFGALCCKPVVPTFTNIICSFLLESRFLMDIPCGWGILRTVVGDTSTYHSLLSGDVVFNEYYSSTKVSRKAILHGRTSASGRYSIPSSHLQ